MKVSFHTIPRDVLLRAFVSFVCIGASGGLLGLGGLAEPPRTAEQAAPSRERLHGVLSRARLSPSLRSLVSQVRFSPDGRYLLVQDESGISLLTVNPLELRVYVRAPEALPARFTADSRTLVVASRALQIWRWMLPDGANVQEEALSVGEGCLASALSSDGELAACYDAELTLRLYRTATGEKILSERIAVWPEDPGLVIAPRVTTSPFAEPVGFLLSNSMKALLGHRSGLTLVFSPDSRYLMIAGSAQEAVAVDILSRKRVNVPGVVKRPTTGAVCFVGPDRLAVLNKEKPKESALVSFPSGDTIARLTAAGISAESASDPRYLRVAAADKEGSQLVDLESGRFLDWLPKGFADMREGVAAILSKDGEVAMYHNGDKESFSRFSLPLRSLSVLRTANVSPNLEGLVLAIHGDGGVYRISTGERVAREKEILGASWEEDTVVYLWNARDGTAGAVDRFLPGTGNRVERWRPAIKTESHGFQGIPRRGGLLLAVETPPIPVVKERAGKLVQVDELQKYQLRAHEMSSGKSLWSRVFDQDTPVPFLDPQGERLVLGWKAATNGARDAATRNPQAARLWKTAKPSEHDSVFEVLDARTGRSLGGVLVQSGAGPDSFSSAFSVGDALVLAKGATRITLYSVSTGEEKARLFGSFPTASAEANLLAACDGTRVTLYDLKTGDKREELLFPEAVVYMHFSKDGKQLFVLTALQAALVLDVSAAARREAPEVPRQR